MDIKKIQAVLYDAMDAFKVEKETEVMVETKVGLKKIDKISIVRDVETYITTIVIRVED